MKRILIGIMLVASIGAFAADSAKQIKMVKDEISTNDVRKITTENNCRVERYSIMSKCMDKPVEIAVVLPPSYLTDTNCFPVLYTLHGYGAPYDTWANMYPLKEALADKPMIVVCFDAGTSWYIDSKVATNSLYETFFFKELNPHVEKNYRVDAEKRGVTGFSMGGFGAFRYAAKQPGYFNSVSGLSSAFSKNDGNYASREKWLKPLLGSATENIENYKDTDCYLLIKQAVDSGKGFPPSYLGCGTEDRLIAGNKVMSAYLKELSLSCEYVESPGAHNWPYWKMTSPEIINFHWKEFNK